MEKKKIRKIALMLALSQLLFNGNMKGAKAHDSQDFILDDKGRIIFVYDSNNVSNKNKTKVLDTDNISAFDFNNTYSIQYGGNQFDFEKNFDNLINNPYIWNEIQKYYPVLTFASNEHAMDFYKIYFNTIADCSCGYVAVADKVFHQFEGREEEFEDIFGYPMYTIDENKVIDFNYEIFILEFFNYAILYPNYNNKNINKVRSLFDKSLARLEYERFINSSEYVERNISNKRLSMQELQEIMKKKNELENEERHLYNKWQNAKDKYKDGDFSLPLTTTLGHVKEFLKKYGIKCQVNLQMKSNGKYNIGDIIFSDGFTLYKENNGKKYSTIENIESHSLYVAEIDEEGRIIVSSWGSRYIFDNSKAKWTSKLVLKLSK